MTTVIFYVVKTAEIDAMIYNDRDIVYIKRD